MVRPPTPKDENQRLQALIEYDVLDSLPEKCFDDLAEIAAQICGTPISLVSLADRDRQWFKAKVGVTATEASREGSFSAHTLGGEFLYVPDAQLDPRFSGNPSVKGEPHLRFYAGAPLITPEGHVLGALCVVDLVPRRLEDTQISALEALARMVVEQLEIRKTNLALNKRISEVSELNLTIERQHKQISSNARMISLAEMAAGMAHEINNPLAIILGKTEQLDNILGAEEFDRARAYSAVRKINETGLRIHRIISSLIAFSRGAANETLIKTSLKSVMSDAVASLSSKCRDFQVTLDVRPFDPNEQVFCLHAQIVQALVNVLSNAIDAVNDCADKTVLVEVRPVGEVTEIHVIDGGPGVATEFRDKLMQPFFTTKGHTRGSGLGLSVAKGLMECQGGSLIFLDDVPKTTFVLQLKRCEDDAPKRL